MAGWPLLVAVAVAGLVSTGSTQCSSSIQRETRLTITSVESDWWDHSDANFIRVVISGGIGSAVQGSCSARITA